MEGQKTNKNDVLYGFNWICAIFSSVVDILCYTQLGFDLVNVTLNKQASGLMTFSFATNSEWINIALQVSLKLYEYKIVI